jgi:hypothetical protein
MRMFARQALVQFHVAWSGTVPCEGSQHLPPMGVTPSLKHHLQYVPLVTWTGIGVRTMRMMMVLQYPFPTHSLKFWCTVHSAVQLCVSTALLGSLVHDFIV